MRTTVNLDADAYDFASTYAAAKGLSLSAALSQLIRRAELQSTSGPDLTGLKRSPHGYLVVAGTGHVLTPEMVREAAEDDLV